jgi:hypothetical protein
VVGWIPRWSRVLGPDQQAALLRVATLVAAQSIANERARAELRASRARIVRTADETRRPPS